MNMHGQFFSNQRSRSKKTRLHVQDLRRYASDKSLLVLAKSIRGKNAPLKPEQNPTVLDNKVVRFAKGESQIA
jgi:hypothetical protein